MENIPADFIALLWWIIITLVGVVGTFFAIIRSLYTSKVDDLKDRVTALKTRLESEMQHNRNQDIANTKAIADSSSSSQELVRAIDRVLNTLQK